MAQEHRENYRITATNDTDRALAQVRRGFNQVESAVTSLQAATARLTGIAAVALGFVQFARAAAEAEVASNRLTAVLRATGNAAGLTKKQLDDMADSMAESTIFDDEAVRAAQANFLKFGNIQGDVFQRGMNLAADYASFVGSEIQDAAQTIGKALQSPEEGITSLERQVGKLDTTQKQNIKTFMEQGRVMEAQRVILDALDKKIGGTAGLINTGLNKSLNDIKKSFGEFSEVMGRAPVGDSFLKFVNQSLVDMKRIIESGDWVASLKFILGFRGMDVKAPVQSSASGIIRGGPADPAIAALQARIDMAREALAKKKGATPRTAAGPKEMSFDELLAKGALKRLEVQEKAEQDAEKAAEEHRKELAKQREALVDLIDPTNQYVRLMTQFRDLHAEGAITTAQLAEAEFILNEKIDEAVAGTRKLQDETKKGSDLAKDLGLTFSSAFEDAIVGGEKLRDVLHGLAKDVLRIFARKTVTEPLGGFLSSAIGSVVGGMFGGGGGGEIHAATGTQFTVGGSGGTDSQHIRMALTPGERVTVETPGQQRAGGGITVVQNIHFSANTPAAVRDAVYSMMPELNNSAVAAVRDDQYRNGISR